MFKNKCNIGLFLYCIAFFFSDAFASDLGETHSIFCSFIEYLQTYFYSIALFIVIIFFTIQIITSSGQPQEPIPMTITKIMIGSILIIGGVWITLGLFGDAEKP